VTGGGSMGEAAAGTPPAAAYALSASTLALNARA
jgi:hypothetical protein